MQQLQLITLAVFILLSSGCSGAAPRSREVLFQSQQPGAEDIFETYIVRPDGTGLRRLTWNTYFDAHPSW